VNPFSQLLSDCRQHLAADPYLADIPILIEGEGRAIAAATRSRAANVATLVFAAAHKLKNLGRVRIEDMSAAGYDKENVEIAVVNPTTITYASAGADEAATAELVGIVTPLLVPINESVEKNLAEGGLLRGATNKGGLAILLMIHRGVPKDRELANAQAAQIRVSLFCKPLLNASGLKKPPLDVHTGILSRMCAWDRGPGTVQPEFLGWDSRENEDGDLGWFSDFNVFHMFD
jgi:hypothetical protein